MIARIVAFDWRLASLFEVEAMSPAALYRLFDQFDRHQTWKRKMKDGPRDRS